MKHAVTDSLYLGNGRNNAVFFAYERFENYFKSRRMVGHIDVCLILFRIGLERKCSHGSFNTNSVTETLCDDFFRFDVEQLVFQRRRTGVDNKNFHFVPPVFSAREPS